jgi:hypothetical protein
MADLCYNETKIYRKKQRANPQELPKAANQEGAETEAGKQKGDTVSLGHEQLTQRADQLIDKMADLYTRQVEAGLITADQLRALPEDRKAPDWKKKAAQKALTALEGATK